MGLVQSDVQRPRSPGAEKQIQGFGFGWFVRHVALFPWNWHDFVVGGGGAVSTENISQDSEHDSTAKGGQKNQANEDAPRREEGVSRL